MDGERPLLAFSEEDGKRCVVSVGGKRTANLAELLETAPALKTPEGLSSYCDVVNYLARGVKYRFIADPDAYRARYEARLQSEDPNAPFQEGAPRLHDFGVCDTSEITLPRVEGESVIFYVENDFLGIPYRVAAPAPDQPEGEITYDPLPMSPVSE